MSDLTLRKLAAIMFTDMVGYSRLAQRDETLALQLLAEHRALLRPIVARHRGREIKTIGDAFLIEFASAVHAVRCAIEMQRALHEHNERQPETRRAQHRIGVHLGDVVDDGTDVLGDGVNLASRIEPLAEPGGICVTEVVALQVQGKLEYPVERVGSKPLKNIAEPVSVHRVALPWLAHAPPPVRARGARARTLVVASAVAVTALIAAIVALRPSPRPVEPPAASARPITSLAVLPLDNLSLDEGQAYFVDGMTEALIAELASISALRVTSRTSAMRYRKTQKPLSQVAQELSVDALIEGSVLREGNQVRVSVKLIDGAADQHRWSGSYQRTLDSIIALQRELARAVAAEIRVHVTPRQQTRLASSSRVDPAAQEDFLRARHAVNRLDEKSVRTAIRLFEQAVARDPGYAPAHAGLAEAHALTGLWYYARPSEAMPRARDAAAAALRLDPALAEAHVTLAQVALFYDWDWNAADLAAAQALDLNANDAKAHWVRAWLLMVKRRQAEALVHAARALRLDPLNVSLGADLQLLYLVAGKFDEAAKGCRKILELEPGNGLARAILALALVEQGDARTAVAEADAALRADQSLLVHAFRADVLARAGERERAKRALVQIEEQSKVEYICPYEIGLAYHHLGEKARALQKLEQAYEERANCMPILGVDPRWEGLRQEPRFVALVQKMRFDP